MTAPDSGAAGPPGHLQQALPPSGVTPQRPAAPYPLRPPVPPGPGVRPPFAAPPQRKEGGTLALWLVLGGFGLLICLVAGGIGFGGALFSAFANTNREAQNVAGDYLEAISEQRYDDAYQMLCRPRREEVSERDFVGAKRRQERIVGYELSSLGALPDGRLVVPATVELRGGETTGVGIVMAREPVEGSGQGADAEYQFRVCGEVERPAPAPS